LQYAEEAKFHLDILPAIPDDPNRLSLFGVPAEFAPQGCYPCQGDNAWLVLTVQTDSEWQSLCLLLDCPELAVDARFSTASFRQVHHDEIDSLISDWTRLRSPLDACEQLQAAGIASGPFLLIIDLTQDPHLLVRSYFQVPAHGDPEHRYPGFPFRLSRVVCVQWSGQRAANTCPAEPLTAA
jgi:crotonobetainyl-CoA:carnitine CoA-transferase CaiB-like acyl-CoA transferase